MRVNVRDMLPQRLSFAGFAVFKCSSHIVIFFIFLD